MSWKELLTREVEGTYKVTEDLVAMVDDKDLDWKPSTGSNWMTTGQLLMHIGTSVCGSAFKGFATGDWGLPEGMDISEMSEEDMMPPAEKMPAVPNVAEAKRLLAADKKTALDTLASLSEEDLATRPAPAPWDQSKMILG